MPRIYLDYASATPVDPRVQAVMLPFFAEHFGNPSGIHDEGVAAKNAVETARWDVSRVLGARPDEIVFTSGVTEAINLALMGATKAGAHIGRHVVSLATEHKATLAALEAMGCEVTLVAVDGEGRVRVDDVIAAIRPDTVLVSVMEANNEIGVVAPLAAIGKAVAKIRRASGSSYPLLHTDAAQAPLFLDCNVDALRVDLMSLSGGKIYGPKGIGALYVRSGTPLTPLLFGGSQEHGLRAGTENVPGIVGFAAALRIAHNEREVLAPRIAALRDGFLRELQTRIPDLLVNGARGGRLPNNLNIAIPGVDGEACIVYLNERGIAASTASSCTAKTSLSHVLRALGYDEARVRGSIRFSLGRATTAEDLRRATDATAQVVALLRA